VGRVAVPTASYFEMGEWALPPAESRAFGAAVHSAQEAGSPEVRWLRGASWRNFQVKYREINDLHKQMLRTSAKVDAMAPGPARDTAMDHLYRGQSNDCYWHGLFGGIYIAHMRAATLSHLIAAEDLADAAAGAELGSEIRDLDLDGRDEIRLATVGQVVTVKLDEGAGIGAWDLRDARHALTGVLRRRPEAYHETLRRHEAEEADAEARPASIHELVTVKESGLADRLVYDEYERRSGLLRFLPASATAATWSAGGRADIGDFVAGPFRIDRLDDSSTGLVRDGAVTIDGVGVPIHAEVELRLGGGRLDPTLEQRVTITNHGDRDLEARVGLEHAITMLGGGGNPAAWWELAGERTSHDGSGSARGVSRVSQGNGWLGVELGSTVSPVADAWYSPIETVSNSEGGFERVYQGSALLLSWRVHLAPGEGFTATVRHEAAIAVDRGATEPGPENPSARGLRATG
jgi:hypothetical protein